jgi:nucleotide-binding universal stress UspA family protein
MKRFKNVLVIPAQLVADDPALVRAARLAEVNQAKLKVIWVLEEFNGQPPVAELTEAIVSGIEAELEKAVAPLRDRNLPVETAVLRGRAFVEIILMVQNNGHDLVMKTARGNALRKNVFFGTTALHLLRKCPCPVWIVSPASINRDGGIMVAVDPDTEDETALAVNRTLMELGTSLAEREGKDLHVLHAWNVPYGDLIRHSPWLRVSNTEVESYFKQIQERHRERFDSLVEPFRSINPDLIEHFYEGIPADVILDGAQDNDIEVIVMATLARSGIPGLMIGNTAESVLGMVECSVITVKTPDFVSPVQSKMAN